jgi:hypothetical protein
VPPENKERKTLINEKKEKKSFFFFFFFSFFSFFFSVLTVRRPSQVLSCRSWKRREGADWAGCAHNREMSQRL